MPSLGAIYIRDISGHAALIDTSGNLNVNVAAGNLNLGAVTVSGNAVAISGQLVSFASGASLNLSGLAVTTTVNTTTNVSGQLVYLGSGNNYVTLSGAVVSVSGNAVTTSISGNAIASGVFLASGLNVIAQSAVTSGEIHIMSGIVGVASGIVSVMSGAISVVSGAISLVSGEVHVVSGQVSVSGLFGGFSGAQTFLSGGAAVSGAIPVIPMMYDLLGKQWTPFSTNISGSTVLSVWQASGLVSIASGALSVTSGVISVLSGDIHVMSGSVTIGSGAATIGAVSVASGAVSLSSGEVHIMSGSVALLAGAAAIGTVTIGSQPISVTTSVSGNAIASGVFLASGIVPNISGQAVSISGNAIGTIAMGNPTMASGFGFSGMGMPMVTAAYDFSGANWVPVNVTASGNNSPLSVGFPTATKIRIGVSGTAVQSGIPSTSGGTSLQSGDLYVITVRNLSGNNTMYVGGSGAPPFSGFGFPLGGGDGLTLSITNANLVSVFAATSGQFIQWIGSQL